MTDRAPIRRPVLRGMTLEQALAAKEAREAAERKAKKDDDSN